MKSADVLPITAPIPSSSSTVTSAAQRPSALLEVSHVTTPVVGSTDIPPGFAVPPISESVDMRQRSRLPSASDAGIAKVQV